MSLLCVNLNAAIDKRYDLSRLEYGRVQRVSAVSASAGGKGLNAARGARLIGTEVIVTGFIGGFAGQFISSQVRALGIRDEFIEVSGESRTCINIIDDAGQSTELLEPGVTVGDREVGQLLDRFTALAGQVRAVTISGSAPAGCPPQTYARLVAIARAVGRPVVLDASGAALAAAIGARPDVVKPNRDELAAWSGRALDTTAALVAAARRMCADGAGCVVVSLGADGAVAVTAERAVQVRVEPVPAMNPVGCGDVLVGVLASGLAADGDPLAALPRAVAAATAAAAHPQTATFDPALAQRLRVDVHPIQELR
jgi:hexose kinase, 1-phosphofructokinase family